MFKDLYLGDGKDNPPFTSRMAMLEEAVKRFGTNSSKLVWIGVAILGTLIVNLVTHFATGR